MNYVLAVDVGTSFTAAAISRTEPPVPESLPLGLRGTAVPSVVYYPEAGPVLVGEAAERRGLDDPARVVREFKRRIGDSVPIAVGALALPAEDIFATMARWVADRAEEREGAPPSEIIISHPAAWGGHRTTAVLAALAAKGLHDVTLISEPEAAALHYASQVRVEDGSTVAVYDLGGGTFDTAVLRKAGNGRFEFLGRPDGIDGLGGADFDAAVLRHVMSHTGEAVAALDPEEPGALAALARLKRECVEAKEALSADSEASISVFLPGLQQQVRVVRAELEAMIEEPLRETVDALERSLEQHGLEPADLSAVLLIGGSSRIPLVAQLISDQLDRPIAVDADPKSAICLGAALAARRAAAEPAAAPAGTAAGLVPTIPGPQGFFSGPHGPERRASWSRKAGATFGALAGPAAAGGVAAGHGQSARGGAHAPRPAIRLTAVAAGAALFTVLTATAAQSPEGLGSLTAMFAPPAAPAGAAPGGAVAGDGGAGAAPGSADAGQAPGPGIEASAKKPADPSGSSTGLEAAASPAGTPSPSSPSAGAGQDAAVKGSAPAGPGLQSDTGPAAGPGTSAGPADPTATPTPATPVTPAPTDTASATPSPATTPTAGPTPAPTPAPTPSSTPPEPTTPSQTAPPPATETPVTPVPSAEPVPPPPPSAPQPEPTVTQTTPQTATPTPDPTTAAAG